MKPIHYPAILLICLSIACHSVSEKKKEEHMHNGILPPATTKAIDANKLIIGGERAGKLYLGQDMQNVFTILGNADDGDAAMGSALGIWYTKSTSDTTRRDPITIFSSYRDSNMVIKVVKQLSVSSPEFSTNNGIHTGFKLSALQSAYPALKKMESYVNHQGTDTVRIYDNISEGIAFDIQKDTCSAITIHPKNIAVNSTYLPVHPGWKRI